jgi:putative acetyltransferase
MIHVLIRDERPVDITVIRDLTQRAFAPMPFADGNEQYLPERFRASGFLTFSLVAEIEGKVVGHVAFTPMNHAGWFALGPISVEPELQRRGIGKTLISAGLDRLRANGAAGCALMGDTNYYPRSGFRLSPELCPENEPRDYFMVLPFSADLPASPLRFHPLFYMGQG